MTPEAALVAILSAAERVGLPYMLVGSLASNFHGVPRSTQDADLVVQMGPQGLGPLAGALPADLELDVQGGFEAVTGTLRHVIRLRGSLFVCELFHVSDDAHDQARFARRLAVHALGRTLWVATAEDMIVTKLRWLKDAARAKDRDDIRNMLVVRGPELDWAYLDAWTARHDTRVLLDEIRRSLPEAM